jgi:autophagy-related protein 13
MHPYQRPSPRTASPASSLQTNPTRTNNQRHSSDRNSYFDTPPYSDRGIDDGDDDMAPRGEHASETDQRQYQKINQVIQVRTTRRTAVVDAC